MAQKGTDIMLQIVNSDLITVKTVEREADDKHPAFLVDEYYPTSDIKIDYEKRPDYKLFPLTKVFRFDDDGHLMVRCRKNDRGRTQTQLQITNKAKYDAEAYLLAIPFCGILVPMPESKYVRIHSATVIRSDEGASVNWDDRAYTTVAYLLVSLNTKAMLEDNVSEVTMSFVSYVTKKVKGGKNFFKNVIEVTLHDDGCFKCTPTMEDEDPDMDFTPPSKDEPRKKAFVLYEAPEYTPRPQKPERKHDYRPAAPEGAFSPKSQRDAKGKKNRH